MPTELTGYFETRQKAEAAVERLVQEYHVDAGSITIDSASGENTAGDRKNNLPGRGEADAAALSGKVAVRVGSEDENLAGKIRSAFSEFGASPSA